MPNLNSPILTGDVSGGLHSTSVDKLKGNAVSATAPTTGQTLLWTGTAWAPATPSSGGGGGANGLTYYLRQDVDADAPTTNLPGTPKQLGRTGATGQTTVTSGTLTAGAWTLLGGYVSEAVPIDPNITAIPGGLWDLNLWALGTANQQSPTVIRAKVYTYNGTDAPTLLATSGEQIINTVSAQYSVSVLVPQTTVELTTRIYIAIEVQASANNHTATLQFGDGTPSHVHTSLPLVGGTGLWKNVAGVLQSPASLLVNADVDAAAAIAQSKINGLTDALTAKAGTAQVDVYDTAGTFTWTKPAGAKLVDVVVISGGGGGASGRKGGTTATAPGGGGGAGGSYSARSFSATLLGATESVTVGAGGTGGAAITGTNVNGNPGQAGGNSSFGTLVQVQGGGGAGIVTTSSGPAGSAASARAMFQATSGATGGTGAGPSTTSATVGAGGGGAGGGLPASATVGFAGGNGGTSLSTWITGGLGTGGAISSNGNAGPSVGTGLPLCSGGGGGGGSSFSANGGDGGNGGLYAGGGGGGGAAVDGASFSGKGGNGAQGIVIVTTYF